MMKFTVYKEIWNELGISASRMGLFPGEYTYLKDYELDKDQTESDCYCMNVHRSKLIRYVMYMNDEDSSLGQIKTDRLISEYQVEAGRRYQRIS